MSYITPGFKYVEGENLKIGFLMASREMIGKPEIIGYQERSLQGQDRMNDTLDEQETSSFFQDGSGIVLTNGPDNKFWVLKDNGEIELTFLK